MIKCPSCKKDCNTTFAIPYLSNSEIRIISPESISACQDCGLFFFTNKWYSIIKNNVEENILNKTFDAIEDYRQESKNLIERY